MDNDHTNDKMLRLIARELNTFSDVLRRVRCHGHVINLACEAFLFGKDKEAQEEALRHFKALAKEEREGKLDSLQTADRWRKFGVLGKIHNINLHIRASHQRYQEFLKLAGRSIPRDNDTRWNSWYLQIKVFIELRQHIYRYIDDHSGDLKLDYLTPEEWEEAIEMRNFLQPFYDTTVSAEGDRDSLDQILTTMDFLVQHYEQAITTHKHNKQLLSRIMVSWYKFDDYYKLTDNTPVYVAAILLHPSLRFKTLEAQWKKRLSKKQISDACSKAKDLWLNEYAPRDISVRGENDSNLTAYQRYKQELYGNNTKLEDQFEDFIKVRLPHSQILLEANQFL
jgi:hypothetical protein